MTEWLKVAVLKTAGLGRAPWVRIPLHPPRTFRILTFLCSQSTTSPEYESLWGAQVNIARTLAKVLFIGVTPQGSTTRLNASWWPYPRCRSTP